MHFPASRPAIPWATAPLLPVAAAFAVGIGGAAAGGYAYGVGFLAVAGLCGLPILFPILRPRPASFALLGAVFGVGAWYATVRHPPGDEQHLGEQYVTGDQVVGTVYRAKPAARGTTVQLAVSGLLREEQLLPVRGRLAAYLSGPAVRIGDRVLLNSPVEPTQGPRNPRAFDYAHYLGTLNVFHRSFADSTEWTLLDTGRVTSLTAYAERWRQRWFASLQPYLSDDELAVAAALIMGKRDLIGTELKSAYADTGAIHVLAVSGLHVGILALLVITLLRVLLPPRPAWLVLQTALAVVAVWGFALITGLSPSVQRAALMVSVVLIGKRLNRQNSVFNLLAIAALLMLLAEPKQLFQVGFQLSFAAVAGIALFGRWLQRLVYLPGKLRYAWDAVAVSTAAQLGTLPLSLYYFGQFPVYFLLSGTLVIGFAYVVLGLGLLHGLLALIGLGTGLTGPLLHWTVKLQNAFIRFCQRLPGATAQLTDFSIWSALGLTALLGTLAYLAFRPSHRARWLAMGLLAALSSYWLLGPTVSPTPPQYTVYHLPRATLIDVYDGRHGLAIGDTLAQDDLDFNVTPWRRTFGVDFGPPVAFTADTTLIAAALHPPLLRLLDHTVLLLDGQATWNPNAPLPPVDRVLVRNGFRPETLGPDQKLTAPVIVDGSNSPYHASNWRAAYPAVWLTSERGAYTVSLTH